jgi:hypothetical protein
MSGSIADQGIHGCGRVIRPSSHSKMSLSSCSTNIDSDPSKGSVILSRRRTGTWSVPHNFPDRGAISVLQVCPGLMSPRKAGVYLGHV